MLTSRKDIAKSIKTMIVALQSMRGQQVAITLRNDSIVTGKVVRVDSNMDVELSDATVVPDPFYLIDGNSEDCNHRCDTYFLLKGTKIRHIEVPEDFDIILEAKREISKIKNRTKPWTKSDII